MVLVENFRDEVLAGPRPNQGLRRVTTKPLNVNRDEELGVGSRRVPGSPTTPATPLSARKENVWRSVFNAGSNLATKAIGAALFDKPQPNTPTVYDWLYSDETRSKHL